MHLHLSYLTMFLCLFQTTPQERLRIGKGKAWDPDLRGAQDTADRVRTKVRTRVRITAGTAVGGQMDTAVAAAAVEAAGVAEAGVDITGVGVDTMAAGVAVEPCVSGPTSQCEG